ncbi:MAG: NAD(P)H-quinone oxidoreductase [Pseudomonadota bacterium]
MRTIEIKQPGGPENLVIGQRAIPTPADDEILVRVAAAGVNGPDMLQRRGHYPPPPGASDLMGLEVSGEVVDFGAAVTRWQTGDKVCGLTNGGGYAEYVAVNAGHCLPIPDGVSLEDAAGLPETYFTVWNNCFFRRPATNGSTFLVHGGAGGIGSTAIQFGAALGMRVFTTCGSDESAEFCKSLGAELAINYRTGDFVKAVRDAGGADMILDIMGGDYVERNFKACNADGRIVQLAFNKGAEVTVNLMPVMLKRLTFTGSTLRPRSAEFKAAVAADLEGKIWPLIAKGKVRPTTFARFPMDDVQKAHQQMEAGGHLGKILLTM